MVARQPTSRIVLRDESIMVIETRKATVGTVMKVCSTWGGTPSDRHDPPSAGLANEKRSTDRVWPETPTPESRRQRLVPIGPVAEYLEVSKATVERLVYRGELPIVKVAGATRYDVEDLDDYIEINRCRNRTQSTEMRYVT
jgi:excisionase family DNA binding protein